MSRTRAMQRSIERLRLRNPVVIHMLMKSVKRNAGPMKRKKQPFKGGEPE